MRVPIPFPLKHVNVWLIDEGESWTVIDCGSAAPGTLELWRELLDGIMRGRPISRIVATHGHVDHIGISGWLSDQHGAKFCGTLGEWATARLSILEPMSERLEVSIQHLREHGCPADVAWSLAKKQHRVTSHIGPLPAVLERVSNGETIPLGGRQWKVIVTGGHAPEHMSLHSAEAGVLIAGDHLLPRITPVIGIYAEMPDANPLQDYLASLATFRRLSDDVLVLPSHGEPYFGLHQRLDDLARHHEDRLATLTKLVDRPISAYEAAQRLFPQGFARGEAALALAETLAHLRYLEARRAILRRRKKGVVEFHHAG